MLHCCDAYRALLGLVSEFARELSRSGRVLRGYRQKRQGGMPKEYIIDFREARMDLLVSHLDSYSLEMEVDFGDQRKISVVDRSWQ